MATRSIIKIEGVKFAKIYKHWDGYPDGMLEWLKAFNEDFAKNRGADKTYKFAQVLRFAAVNAEKYNLDANLYTGWGVVDYNDNWGEEYEYTLHDDGTVTYVNVY